MAPAIEQTSIVGAIILRHFKDKNVGLNVGLNKTEKAVLGLLIETPNKTADEIASAVGVTKRTIERSFVSLQKKGKIERVGSKRDGLWVVIK